MLNNYHLCKFLAYLKNKCMKANFQNFQSKFFCLLSLSIKICLPLKIFLYLNLNIRTRHLFVGCMVNLDSFFEGKLILSQIG